MRISVEGLRTGRAVILVDAEDGANAAGVLAHDLLAVDPGEPGDLAAQHRDFAAVEQVGEHEETVAIELLDLLVRQFHDAASLVALRR